MNPPLSSVGAIWNGFTGAIAFVLDAPEEHLDLARERLSLTAGMMKHLQLVPAQHVDRLSGCARDARGAGDYARSSLFGELNRIADALVYELDPPQPPDWRKRW